MYFKLIYNPAPRAGYHARLYSASGQLLFWTHDYKTKQQAVDVCAEVRRNMRSDAPIYDID